MLALLVQEEVYTILCFSEMSLPRDDIFPDLIILTSPHEHLEDPIPRIFKVTLQATKPTALVDGKDYF